MTTGGRGNLQDIELPNHCPLGQTAEAEPLKLTLHLRGEGASGVLASLDVWHRHYNHVRPHSNPKDLTPIEFKTRYDSTNLGAILK